MRTLVVLSLAVAACGGSSKKAPCDPVAQSGCAATQVCEHVPGAAPICTAPVVVSGTVVRLADGTTPIAGARVVALDANRAPLSDVVVTGADGAFRVPVPHDRTSGGAPVGRTVTLRADAPGYVSFPSGLRQAVPIDTSAPVVEGAELVVRSELTRLELDATAPGAGTASITGKVQLAAGQTALVVAEGAGGAASALPDRRGAFALLNLPAGDYTVRALARGASFAPATASLPAGGAADVALAPDGAPTATVSGSVQIVNGGQGTATSIILVPEPLFDPALARGESPPGFRAPEPGVAPNVTGGFQISGVPAGRYKVLAAFENDFLVRDPDAGISGTAIVTVDVPAGGGTVVLPQSFKVTGALDVVSPGASGPEPVTGAPVLRWKDDSSEDSYRVSVVNARGVEIWSKVVPGSSGADPQVAYDGAPLAPGTYQFRAVSQKACNSTQSGICLKSMTEDLKGVFVVPAP